MAQSAALLLLAAGVLAVLLLESTPLLDPARKLTHDEMVEARSVLDFGIRSARHLGVTNTVSLSNGELDATVNYLLQQFVTGVGHFRLEREGFTFIATARIPSVPVNIYLNAEITATTENDRLAIRRVRLGDANFPTAWVDAGLSAAQRFSAVAKFISVADKAVKEVTVEPDRLLLVYGWDSDTLHNMRDLILDITSKKRLRHYQARLTEVVNGWPVGNKRMALGDLLQPLFTLAMERSEERDPIEENRALLLVVSAYLSGHKSAPVLAAKYSAESTARRTVRLNNRLDLAKHFIISAALAASANSTFADMAGLAKEIDDSHGGSGFNFQDLAADMAGQRFGELAVLSEKSARRLQKRLSRNAADSIIMPVVRDLPENLDAETFASRYQAVGSPAFEEVEGDIQQRLDAMALYWQASGD
ncbi:hypothetical protein [Methylogaea oryzae]|uniref:Uncharacterized protein n=1 Tax=Methylogaea oryzae TaxID=1295382 RepID=A0A8D4VND3_9GAMM|nr:hypothetical protein [Methylogaea oryzae]BBL71073.1 hypothetical protein MoryE10_16790 [Methylogaea oryzae]